MEQETHFSEKSSSLLMLNDDCLLDIFNFLPLKDYVNLAETCRRLLGIAQQYRIFRNIKVVTQREFYYIRIYNSIQIVPENTRLSVIGTHGTRFDDLSILIQNLSKAKLEGIGRFPFQSLKELKLSREVFLKITDWQNIFTNNPGIENLEYVNGFCDDVDGKYMLKMIELLIMLPKLKSLKIKNMFESESTETEYLSESVSPFTYGSRKDYYEMSHQLLIELGKNLNLVEFEYFMAGERIDTLKSFRNLEVLSITAKPCQFHSKDIETRIFPAMLKQIKLCYIEVPCSVFLSIIKQLKFLEEFHIGDGEIYDDECGLESFPSNMPDGGINGSNVISQISKELRREKRKLKLSFNAHHCEYKQDCKYSDNLEIIPQQHVEKAVDHSEDHSFRLGYRDWFGWC